MKSRRKRGTPTEKTRLLISRALSGKRKKPYKKKSTGALSSEHRRTLSERMTGRRYSIEHRNKMSLSRLKYLESTGGPRVKWFEVGGQFVQGNYERIVAEKLLSDNITWKKCTATTHFEYTLVDGTIHRYIPDFYLPDFDLFIEVKGWWSDTAITKMISVLEQNTINMLFIDGDSLESFDLSTRHSASYFDSKRITK